MPFQCTASTGPIAVDATTYITTGTAFPEWALGSHQVMIANLHATVAASVKFGGSTGPNASNSTDSYPRLCIPPLTTVVFTRSFKDSHWYAHAASTGSIALMSGSE